MLTLTEPQVWVLMGVFATAIFGMMSWQTVSFNRNLTTSIDSMREAIGYRFEAMDVKLDALSARVDGLTTRVDALSVKLDGLDKDVQALTRHVFRDGPHSS